MFSSSHLMFMSILKIDLSYLHVCIVHCIQVSLVGVLWLMGLYISSLSSCLGGLYGAPRILQCIANENVIPFMAVLGHGVSQHLIFNEIRWSNRQIQNCTSYSINSSPYYCIAGKNFPTFTSFSYVFPTFTSFSYVLYKCCP